MARTKKEKEKEKTIAKKFFLTEKQIELLNNACIHYHLNLSSMVGRMIEHTDTIINKEKISLENESKVDAMEFVKNNTEQIANLEHRVMELQASNKEQIYIFENTIAELQEKLNEHISRYAEFTKQNNEFVSVENKRYENLSKRLTNLGV